MAVQDLESLRESIHRTPIATIITDNLAADNPIVEANDAFVALTGYPAEEIVGRNCRFLAGRGTELEAQSVLRKAVVEGKPAIVEITNYRKDGSPFRNAVMLAPICGDDGSVAMFIGSQMEIATVARATAFAGLAHANLFRADAQASANVGADGDGYRNKQIGGFLGIEEKTVKMLGHDCSTP